MNNKLFIAFDEKSKKYSFDAYTAHNKTVLELIYDDNDPISITVVRMDTVTDYEHSDYTRAINEALKDLKDENSALCSFMFREYKKTADTSSDKALWVDFAFLICKTIIEIKPQKWGSEGTRGLRAVFPEDPSTYYTPFSVPDTLIDRETEKKLSGWPFRKYRLSEIFGFEQIVTYFIPSFYLGFSGYQKARSSHPERFNFAVYELCFDE